MSVKSISFPNPLEAGESETSDQDLQPTGRQTDKLPLLLQKGVNQFKEERDKDLFLIGALTVASGLLTKVSGEYNRVTAYPNLYSAVIGPPASGKSALVHASRLTKKIHDHKRKESEKAREEYKRLLSHARTTGETPKRPPYTVVNLSANCSSSKFITHLADNQEGDCPSVLFESEIDTINIVRRSEWGDFSDILRKAFQSEPISKSRTGNDEYLEVTCPKPAIAISGTSDQLRRFITNAEDGLFTRFIFHTLDGNSPWVDVSPCDSCPNLTEFFEVEQAAEYFDFWQFISGTPLKVDLKEEQWQTLNKKFGESLREVTEHESPGYAGIVKRHGLMLFKMCMVFTAFRKYEEKNASPLIYCRQEDFEIALSLIQRSLDHSLELVDLFPSRSERTLASGNRVYDRLPGVFSFKQAMAVAKPLGISERTVQRYLRNALRNRVLEKDEKGLYRKHHVSVVSDDGQNI